MDVLLKACKGAVNSNFGNLRQRRKIAHFGFCIHEITSLSGVIALKKVGMLVIRWS